MTYDASRAMNGSWGQLWEDSREIAEVSAFQCKLNKNYETVAQCGTMMEDRKLVSCTGTGSMTISKVFTRCDSEVDQVLQGHDIRRSLVGALRDPDAFGAERVALYGVSYDELALMDWESKKVGTVTVPFAFTGIKYLDKVEVQ